MKALTVHQPYASLIAIGAKRIETRSWSTSYRGPLAIHAAALTPVGDLALGDWRWQRLHPHRGCLWKVVRRLTTPKQGGTLYPAQGAVVATCRLVDVLPIYGAPDPLPQGERCVGLDPEGDVRLWKPDEMAGYPMHVGEAAWSPEREEGWTAENEAAFGDYSTGRYAFLLADVEPLDPPIPAKGRQGLFELPKEAEYGLRASSRD